MEKRHFESRYSTFDEKHHAEQGKDEFDRVMAHKRDVFKQKNEKTEQERRDYYEEDLKDEKMLKNVMSQIAEDDFKLIQHKMEMNEMLESQAEKKVVREQHKAFAAQEEHYNEEGHEKVDRDAYGSAHRPEEIEQRQSYNAHFGAAVEDDEAETKRRADLAQQLQDNEYVEKSVQADQDKKDRVKQANLDNQDALVGQMQYKVDAAAKERVLNAEFYKLNEDKMFENDEKDRLNELEKKEINMQYGRDLQKQILENAARRKREFDADHKRDVVAETKWQFEADESVREVQEYDKA